ncbi:hypothetical protein RHCRD62_30508 [Rhodococcus sp. RD6.2]|nr:hypothetical protein RHCRD62_30508 [Rhodococcus sp. RD6.2]
MQWTYFSVTPRTGYSSSPALKGLGKVTERHTTVSTLTDGISNADGPGDPSRIAGPVVSSPSAPATLPLSRVTAAVRSLSQPWCVMPQ